MCVAPCAAAHAQVTYTWNALGGNLNVASNYSPNGVPGAADTVQIIANARVIGFNTIVASSNQSVGTFVYGHYSQQTIDGATATTTITVPTGQFQFTDGITESPGVALNSLFFRAVLAGASGLEKSGPGFLFLSNNNTYINGTTILGTGTGRAGGVSIVSDSNLGAAGAAVTLKSGGVLRTTTAITTSRPILLTNDGGRIENFDNLTLTGQIAGNGFFTRGRYTTGVLEIANASNPFAGAARFVDGSRTVLSGALANAILSIDVAGQLTLGKAGIAANNNRISDFTEASLYGGSLGLIAGTSTTTESTYGLRVNSGESSIELTPNASAGAAFTFDSFIRAGRSTFTLRGRDLGNGPVAANRANVFISDLTNVPRIGANTSATTLPIVPIAYGINNSGAITAANVTDAGFVTYGANGLRVLRNIEYATSFSGVADNVLIENGSVLQNSDATVNSLLIRDTLLSSGNTGVTGTGVITIDSGAIAAVSDLGGEELKIDNPIQFNGREGVAHVAMTSDGTPATLHLRGPIAGTLGFTKAGPGTLHLENTASTFDFQFTVSGGDVVFQGDVPATGPSALGAGGISINAGANGVVDGSGVYAPRFVSLLSDTPEAKISRDITVSQYGFTNDLALLGSTGAPVTYAGNIYVAGGFLNLLGATLPGAMTISGIVSGVGGLQEPRLNPVELQTIELLNANTYFGGTVLRAATWRAGDDAAFGNGTIWFEGGSSTAATIEAVGGPRTIANAVVMRASSRFAGSQPITFTGPVDLGGVNRQITVAGALGVGDVTMANVDRGGIVKIGPGRLILSGANGINSSIAIQDGVLRASNSGAFGSTFGTAQEQATFLTGNGILELAGGITTGEAIFFGASGTPLLLSSPTGNLRSISGANTLTGTLGVDGTGTVGVDAGSSLTVSGALTDNGSGALRKVGAGPFITKNVRLGTMTISAGTVKMLPDATNVGASRVTGLTISTGATLDLGKNAFVLEYFSVTPIATIRGHLLAGRIIASDAGAGARVGYAETSALFTTFPNTFAGFSVDATAIVMRATLAGDATLDGTVNFDDLLKLAASYNQSAVVWTQGDFTYDGTTNFDDLLLLAANYNQTFTGSLAGDFALAQAIVPEPAAMVGLLAVPAMLRRRRR